MTAVQGVDMTATETKTLTTLRADELQPGDVVKLISAVGNCVGAVERQPPDRCVILLLGDNDYPFGARVWLWKYSRVEIYSDVKGRGHLASPMQVSVTDSVSMEEVKA